MMLLKLLLRLTLVDLILRGTANSSICRRSDRVQILLPNRTSECICNNTTAEKQQERFVGANIELRCNDFRAIFSRKGLLNNSWKNISTDNNRFSIHDRILTISNIQPEDEGMYRCFTHQHGYHYIRCLTVSGSASFMTCDSNYTMDYPRPSMAPTFDNSCSQYLNVTEGENILFDTRLKFREQGNCHCIEDIKHLTVHHPYHNSTNEYICDERESNCINKRGYTVKRASEQPYDFSLVLPQVNMSHSGTYYVRIEAGKPGESSIKTFWKIFEIRVAYKNSSISDSNSTTASTLTTTDMGKTTNDYQPTTVTYVVSSTTPAVDTVGRESRTTIGATVGTVAVLVIISIIVVITVLILLGRKKWRTRTSSKQELVTNAQERDKIKTLTIEETGLCQLHFPVGKARPISMNHDVPLSTIVMESNSIIV